MLCHTFNAPQNSTVVGNLLNRAFTFEVERHQKLVEFLGMPDYAVGFDFRHIESGDFPEDLTAAQITRIGPAS